MDSYNISSKLPFILEQGREDKVSFLDSAISMNPNTFKVGVRREKLLPIPLHRKIHATHQNINMLL